MKIETSPDFDRELKRLKKKYSSLTGEIEELVWELRQTPTMGTPIGRSCYKIRLAIKSKGKGKSGGARVNGYEFLSIRRVPDGIFQFINASYPDFANCNSR